MHRSAFRLPLPRPRRARAGFSLFEVLIAIGVLLIGLWGVASVLPLGRLRIVQTAQSDRSAACGTAALNEVKTRRMLDPSQWLWRVWHNGDPVIENSNELRPRHSFAIDPLFLAQNSLDPNLDRFPYCDYDSNNLADDPYTTDLPFVVPKMRRITLDVDPGPNCVPMPFSVADRIFTWQDDLTLPVPDDDTDRPRQMMGGVDTKDPNDANDDAPLSFAWPPRPAADGVPSSGLEPKMALCESDYTWLVTVTPKPNRTATGEVLPPDIYNDRLYRVSVVVFYNRDFSPPNQPLYPDKPGERRVQAQVLGGGWSGGEVRLITPGSAYPSPGSAAYPDPPGDYAATYLDVKKGEWLLLMAGDATPGQNDPPYLFRWYRIVSVGETLSEDLDGSGSIDGSEVDYNNNSGEIDWFREVTLAGPDWQGPTAPYLVEAGLFTGVIGVYTRVMELDDIGSLWSD